MINWKKGMMIQHRKGGRYKIIAIGKVKIDGTWYPSVTYQSTVGMGEVYTRASSNMLGFSLL